MTLQEFEAEAREAAQRLLVGLRREIGPLAVLPRWMEETDDCDL